MPPLNGTLNENPMFALWVTLALWFSDLLQSKTTGEAFATISGAIRHGLHRVGLPYVSGWLPSENENPADQATVMAGEYRISTMHRDHTGAVINPAYSTAYKNRVSTVNLAESVREVCGCGLDGCLIHPVEKTGGGERVMGGGVGTRRGGCVGIPTGEFVTVGDIGLDYQNKINDGRGDDRMKVPILTMRGGRVVIGKFRTLIKRSGNGKNPTQPVAYRYGTTCNSTALGVCGAGTCFGLCSEDDAGLERGAHSMRFALVNTHRGRTMVGLDPRGRYSVATIRAALEAQEGVAAVIVQPVPFESGVASATPTNLSDNSRRDIKTATDATSVEMVEDMEGGKHIIAGGHWVAGEDDFNSGGES